MRILFVVPYPISRIRIRSYGFVTQLATQHDLTVLALCATEKDCTDMQALQHHGIRIIPIREKIGKKFLRCARALGTRLPLQVAYDAAPALRAAISAHLASGQFDLLHVEFIRALGALPTALPVPVVWDAVDCISQLYEQGARFGATPMLRLIGKREARRTRQFELQQLQRFQQVLVTSERDRQALLALTQDCGTAKKNFAEITVLPHGVDQHYFRHSTAERRSDTLIFTGKMSFHANVAGVQTLVQDILPLIWEKRPAIHLLIVGSNPPAAVRRLARDPRIEITGYVPDLRPYLAQAQIAVSPLPYAMGIQNKVLEAMALGTPVIASSSAGAGLQVVPGRDLLIADEPEAFAGAVLRLLEDRTLWNQLVEHGLTYIAAHHNWARILARLTAVYERAGETAHLDDVVPLRGKEMGRRLFHAR